MWIMASYADTLLRLQMFTPAKCFESLLGHGGFENLIHEKGARNHPLSDAANELNRIKSAIRACFWPYDHVNGWKADEKDRA
jgi:hypothetical protein